MFDTALTRRRSATSADRRGWFSPPPHSPCSLEERHSPLRRPRQGLTPTRARQPSHCCALTTPASPRPKQHVQSRWPRRARWPTSPSRMMPSSLATPPRVFTERVSPRSRRTSRRWAGTTGRQYPRQHTRVSRGWTLLLARPGEPRSPRPPRPSVTRSRRLAGLTARDDARRP